METRPMNLIIAVALLTFHYFHTSVELETKTFHGLGLGTYTSEEKRGEIEEDRGTYNKG